MKVILQRYPTDYDWQRALYLARNTAGSNTENVPVPSLEWKRNLIRSKHSPLRTLMFTVEVQDLPYYSSVHFTRHKFGIEHYVRSQRKNPERGAERQDAPVTHIMDMNAAELLEMAGQRLCYKADPLTYSVMKGICTAVISVCPEFDGFLLPKCRHNVENCPEFKPCGTYGQRS